MNDDVVASMIAALLLLLLLLVHVVEEETPARAVARLHCVPHLSCSEEMHATYRTGFLHLRRYGVLHRRTYESQQHRRHQDHLSCPRTRRRATQLIVWAGRAVAPTYTTRESVVHIAATAIAFSLSCQPPPCRLCRLNLAQANCSLFPLLLLRERRGIALSSSFPARVCVCLCVCVCVRVSVHSSHHQ